MRKATRKAKGLSDLYRLHSSLYDMTYKDSCMIVDSVLDSIKEMMTQTEVLQLQGFGKFQNKQRKAYTVSNNLPCGVDKAIPPKPGTKFYAYTELNSAAAEFFHNLEEK